MKNNDQLEPWLVWLGVVSLVLLIVVTLGVLMS